MITTCVIKSRSSICVMGLPSRLSVYRLVTAFHLLTTVPY